MLDASTRIDVLNLLGELKSRGLGVLFITHDLSLGNYISDETIILRHGAVVERGATTKVFGNPFHPYTKLLLASVPQLHTKWGAREEELEAPIVSTGDGSPAGDGHLPDVVPQALVEVEADHFAVAESAEPRSRVGG
jgi:peptide/nickel transport system ATP-binding protein